MGQGLIFRVISEDRGFLVQRLQLELYIKRLSVHVDLGGLVTSIFAFVRFQSPAHSPNGLHCDILSSRICEWHHHPALHARMKQACLC